MTQDKTHFQHLLFKVAFCTVACDGDIDEMEIREMKALQKASIYFKDIDLSDELNGLLATLKDKGKRIIDELAIALKTSKLNYVQELLVLEVALRLAMANKKIDENEVKFIRFLRACLNVNDEMIRDRFGTVEYLFDRDYAQEIVKDETYTDLLANISMPESKDIQNIHLMNWEEEK